MTCNNRCNKCRWEAVSLRHPTTTVDHHITIQDTTSTTNKGTVPCTCPRVPTRVHRKPSPLSIRITMQVRAGVTSTPCCRPLPINCRHWASSDSIPQSSIPIFVCPLIWVDHRSNKWAVDPCHHHRHHYPSCRHSIRDGLQGGISRITI